MSAHTRKWFFPLLGGGEEQGLNEPGIENFKKGQSLGRETLQNIGDARSKAAVDAGEPAIAEFELLSMPVTEIPGRAELLEIFRACRDYIPKRFGKKADREANGAPLFERAVNALDSSKPVAVLRIRDRNTTGLVGSNDPSNRNSPWWRLIRGQGYSSSEGVGGGTYGIGQRAPFAFSELRTVLYYTRLEGGEEAFVAKALLCSFPHPTLGKLTQRTGWYCSAPEDADDEWSGITSDIPRYFRRKVDDTGTDLYILGYRNAGLEWKSDILRSVLRNFFAAVDAGMLTVRIRDTEGECLLEKETLEQLLVQECRR